MEGEGDGINQGLISRSVQMIFNQLDSFDKREWTDINVSISCIEIHIETVRDLLDTNNQTA